MNFLFLTTMMILIFTFVSTSMTTSLKTTAKIYFQLDNQISTFNRSCNNEQKENFSNSKKYVSDKKTNEEREENRRGQKYIPRSTFPHENSKLNLYPLVNGNFSSEQRDLLKITLKNLIYELYKTEPFYLRLIDRYPNYLDTFVNEITLGLKETAALSKIPFLSRENREVFLLLCKGTYPAANKQLPLLNYITYQKVDDAPFIAFRSLSRPLLRAFFGEETTSSILIMEKKRYYAGHSRAMLEEDELMPLLTSSTYSIHKNMLRYTNIKYSHLQSHIKGDDGLFITLKQPVPVS